MSASILLVEDDVLNQMIASRLLDRLGHQVRIANNGQEALDELETYDFDLILMDMQMPVMDGIEATRRLRSNGNTLPVLAFTANTSADDHRLCLEAGMQDVLIKPVQLESLNRMLEHFL
ncbi:response regulator [Vreelandella aquamarina]